MSISAATANLPHQVHTHCIAAKRKKCSMTKAEYAKIPPDQIHSNSQQRIAEVLAQQGHGVGGDMQGAALREEKVAYGNHKCCQ